jgi:ribosomal protein S18 acetylase RimI-like enzyme
MTSTMPLVALREVDSEDGATLAFVASLHEQLLDHGPLAALGADFLRTVCYRAPMRDGSLKVVVAEVDGVPAGFAAYTPDSERFHATALRGHWLLAAWWVARSLLARPSRLPAVVRILRMMVSRIGEPRPSGESGESGEVEAFAVSQRWANAEFRKRSGRWISRDLVAHVAEQLSAAGCDQLRMFVAADNIKTLLFYQFLGGRFERLRQGGEPTVGVTFDLPMKSVAPA